jgi:hypothetical protein
LGQQKELVELMIVVSALLDLLLEFGKTPTGVEKHVSLGILVHRTQYRFDFGPRGSSRDRWASCASANVGEGIVWHGGR